MKIGFTGAHQGMTDEQLHSFKHLFSSCILGEDENEFHHGLCIGADAEAHDVAVEAEVWVVGHPPSDPKGRVYRKCEELLPEKDYLRRNKDIVDATEVLIATPYESANVLRSGPWSTVRYALKKNKPTYIILPNGEIEEK